MRSSRKSRRTARRRAAQPHEGEGCTDGGVVLPSHSVVRALRRRFAEQAVRPSSPTRDPRWVLYLEGAQDRGPLEAWARRVSPRFAQELGQSAVILGGRRIDRAASRFEEMRGRDRELRGVCILNRDDVPWPLPSEAPVTGLDVFVWPRRQIESYLLVPAALRRSLRLAPHDPRLERYLATNLPDLRDEDALGSFDAKRLIGLGGSLGRALGRFVRPSSIARSMRLDELHRDVLEALHRIGVGSADDVQRTRTSNGSARRVR